MTAGATKTGATKAGGMRFAEGAGRLAGFAGAVLGWSPDGFWAATPAELAAVVAAMLESRGIGDAGTAPPDAAAIARMREAFPDG